MKKLLSILLSILLVSTLVFSVTACKDTDESESIDETVTPVTITVKTEKEDGKEINTLTEISLSAAAKSYVDDKDYENLKTLFSNHGVKGFTIDSANAKVKFEIPSNVTHIATNAVANLTFITDLVVGPNVVEIEKGAFVGLSGLESITLPFVGGKIGAIKEARLFAYIFGSIGGTGLTAVTQTYSDANESTSSLYVPSLLKTVTVTGDVKVTEGTQKHYIKDGVHYSVDSDYAEPTITVDGEVYNVIAVATKNYSESAIQPYAFHSITTIETVNLSANTTEIPEYAFYGCTGIKTLTFKDGFTIGKYAFANCTSLRDLTLNAVILGEGAFSGCTALGKATEISLGGLDVSKVTSFGKDAFAGCTSLTKENLVAGAHTEDFLADAFDKDFFEEDED